MPSGTLAADRSVRAHERARTFGRRSGGQRHAEAQEPARARGRRRRPGPLRRMASGSRPHDTRRGRGPGGPERRAGRPRGGCHCRTAGPAGLPDRPRNGDGVQHRDGQEPRRRADHADRLPRGARGPPGGPPRGHRPAALGGGAPTGAGQPRPGCRAPRRRAAQPRTEQRPLQPGDPPPAAVRRAGLPGPSARGGHPRRSGPDRQRAAAAGLLSDHGADQREGRAPPRGRRATWCGRRTRPVSSS